MYSISYYSCYLYIYLCWWNSEGVQIVALVCIETLVTYITPDKFCHTWPASFGANLRRGEEHSRTLCINTNDLHPEIRGIYFEIFCSCSKGETVYLNLGTTVYEVRKKLLLGDIKIECNLTAYHRAQDI